MTGFVRETNLKIIAASNITAINNAQNIVNDAYFGSLPTSVSIEFNTNLKLNPELIQTPAFTFDTNLKLYPELIQTPAFTFDTNLKLNPELIQTPVFTFNTNLKLKPELVQTPVFTFNTALKLKPELVQTPVFTFNTALKLKPELVQTPVFTFNTDLRLKPELVQTPIIEFNTNIKYLASIIEYIKYSKLFDTSIKISPSFDVQLKNNVVKTKGGRLLPKGYKPYKNYNMVTEAFMPVEYDKLTPEKVVYYHDFVTSKRIKSDFKVITKIKIDMSTNIKIEPYIAYHKYIRNLRSKQLASKMLIDI